MPNLKQLAKPFIRKKEMADRAKDYIKSLRIKTHTHLTEAKNLSGGNQQKVVIAKWLYSNADVYIFDEPTRGIDVGARDEIYNIMYDLVNQGASIIMISSDLVEVLKMCDRVAVMREGVLEAILDNSPDLTQETILKLSLIHIYPKPEGQDKTDNRMGLRDTGGCGASDPDYPLLF